MSDTQHGDLPPADTIDTGEPIKELALLRVEPESGFLGRFRRAVGRRLLGAQLGDFFSAAGTVFLELLTLVLQW